MALLKGWEKVKFGEASAIQEYHLIWGIMALLRPRSILEIGTSTGIGTIAMLDAVHNFGSKVDLVTIDIESKIDIVQHNATALGVSLGDATFLVGDSRKIVPELRDKGRKFDVVFIDGLHKNGLPLADWKNTNKMTNMWMLHDSTQFHDVRELVKKIRASGKYDVFEFSRYPFGRQYHPKKGGFFTKGTIPGITLVRRTGTHHDVGPKELQWLKDNRH